MPEKARQKRPFHIASFHESEPKPAAGSSNPIQIAAYCSLNFVGEQRSINNLVIGGTMSTATPGRMSEQEAKEAHLIKMEGVAKCIINPVPPWLSEVLLNFSFDVRSQDSIDQIWPTRKQLWESLARGHQLAIELQAVLNSVGVAGFLATNSKLKSEERLQRLAAELSEFEGFSAEACKSPLLGAKKGKKKTTVRAGADKALLPGVKPAKYVCAAIIAEVICFFAERGNPRPSRRKANAAAERLWTSWPVSEKRTRTDPTKAWDRYFDAADDPKLAQLRKKVRKHLGIRASRGT